mmetsp:Transcript_24759/g.30943  ORF Transcript_24759/g.30943 Transcript_24759/m.30943 type:complete len:115 (-) Transcript_24759:745-1089(-)
MLVFEKCDPSWSPVPCKSEAEIADWMLYKYFVMLSNRKKFSQHKFGEARMESSLQIEWYPLSSRLRTDYVNMIVRQSSDLNDHYFSLGSLTIEDEDGFEIERKMSRELVYRNNF